MARITGADESTVAFLVSPLTSITGVMQMHLAADRHAALVLEDRFDADASLERIDAHGATLLGGAPVIAERLLRAAAARADAQDRAAHARARRRDAAACRCSSSRPTGFGIEVARVYGSSEAPNATGSLPGTIARRACADDGALMPGTEVRVGSREHPQEGLLRGPAVFLGYVDPTTTRPRSRTAGIRTGDAVELHAGRLTVVGRLKDVDQPQRAQDLAERDRRRARAPAGRRRVRLLRRARPGDRRAARSRGAPGGGPRAVARGRDRAPRAPRARRAQAARAARGLERAAAAHRVGQDRPVPARDGIAGKAHSRFARPAGCRDAPGDAVLPTPEDHVAISRSPRPLLPHARPRRRRRLGRALHARRELRGVRPLVRRARGPAPHARAAHRAASTSAVRR